MQIVAEFGAMGILLLEMVLAIDDMLEGFTEVDQLVHMFGKYIGLASCLRGVDHIT